MKKAFIRNRTEEFGHDIWDSYILPPYFNNLGLREARKSHLIVGGRGSGKTALLRYLSYESQFSETRREALPEEALDTIGLYLKADTNYFSGFVGGGLDERKWQNIFEHALCIGLAEQLIDTLKRLNCNHERQSFYGGLDSLKFNKALSGFSKKAIPDDIDEFYLWIKSQKQELSRWFKNFDCEIHPELFSLHDFLSAIIDEYKSKLPYLKNTVFAVFIDEYENLLDYQQRVLNTAIKSGEPPLIFHIAMKPNGMRHRLTIGTETIQDIADYRTLNLDDLLINDFDLFAAELFFFRLIKVGFSEFKFPVSKYSLQKETEISNRKTDIKYKLAVLAEVRRVLPGISNREIAAGILNDPILFKRCTDLLEESLKAKNSDLSSSDFFDNDYAEASLVCVALLNQIKEPVDVLVEFNNLRANAVSKFKEGDWIHHFLLGTILLIYMPFRQRPNPVYAGFDVFTKLSKTNIRHFLELCHQSIDAEEMTGDYESFSVPFENQANAAFRVSFDMKEEVSGCGTNGNRLLSIVNFLGKLFRLSQARLSQSEPERTHFSIVNDQVGEDAQKVLDEAVKWSVLFQTPETKVKGTRYESSEYILNPIFAPFFGISFNKGRKLEIPYTQAEEIFTGEVNQYTSLLRTFEKKWSTSSSSDQISLDF
jgi:hypothetical protein